MHSITIPIGLLFLLLFLSFPHTIIDFTHITYSLWTTLKMEAVCSSKITVPTHQPTWCHIPDDKNLYQIHCKNLNLAETWKWTFRLYVRHFFTNLATSNFSLCKQLTSIKLDMLLLNGKCQYLLYLEHSPDKAVQHIPFCFSTQEKRCNHAWWWSIPFFYIFMVTAMGTKENWNYNAFAIRIWSRITRM